MMQEKEIVVVLATDDEGCYWLRFGKYAAVCINTLKPDAPITQRGIMAWATAQMKSTPKEETAYTIPQITAALINVLTHRYYFSRISAEEATGVVSVALRGCMAERVRLEETPEGCFVTLDGKVDSFFSATDSDTAAQRAHRYAVGLREELGL